MHQVHSLDRQKEEKKQETHFFCHCFGIGCGQCRRGGQGHQSCVQGSESGASGHSCGTKGTKKDKTHLVFFWYLYQMRWGQAQWARLSVIVITGLGQLDKKERTKKRKQETHFVVLGSVSGAIGAHMVG
jgi:hypothetical protein